MIATKKDIEDVVPIEENKEQQEKVIAEMSKSLTIQRFKTSLVEIQEYITSKNITLEELRQEIENKKCALSKSRREFVLAFKLDFIQELLDQLFKTRSKIEQFKYDD